MLIVKEIIIIIIIINLFFYFFLLLNFFTIFIVLAIRVEFSSQVSNLTIELDSNTRI